MKRKLLLMAGSFIILLLAFGTYQLFVPGVAFLDPMGGARRQPPALVFDPTKGPSLQQTKDITIYYRNPDGQLRGIYKAVSWTKEDDGSFILEQPEAIIYQRDGTRVYLRADRGRFWAEEVAGGAGFNIRHGEADGKVEIFYDQSTDDDYHGEERPHPKDRPYEDMIHDVLRVVTSDIKFSRDLLELRTESEVTIWSRQLDMNGKGLLLQWSEDPRELTLLRLKKGNILIVKDLPKQVDLTQLPTEDKDNPETAPATQPAEEVETGPTEQDGWGLVATATKKQRGVEQGKDVNVIGEAEPGEEQLAPRTAPALPEAPKMRNIYQATFSDDVRIFSGLRSLTGAKELSLTFEWDRAWRSDRKSAPKSSEEDDEEETQTIAAADDKDVKEEAPATQPAEGSTTKPKWASRIAAAGVRDMKIDEEEAKSSERQMAIYWDGPLEIQPEGRTDTPDRNRYSIAGHGQQVRLTDEDARILCTKFQFKNPQQEATFEGTKERPSRVQLARGDEITCQGKIRFVRSEGKAYLEGPGELVRYARDDEETSNWSLVPVEQAPWRLLLDRITWAKDVEASFDERKMPTKNGGEETRPYIKGAVFRENVKMVQYAKPTARGEDGEIKSSAQAMDHLQVWMGLTDEGKNYPSRVEADGTAGASLGESNIKAGHVDISFRPAQPKDDSASQSNAQPTDSPDAAKAGNVRDDLSALGESVEPTDFYASGDVSITYQDPKKLDEPPLRIEADMIRASDIDSRQKKGLAVLTGTPAKIWQGDRNIQGAVIRFDTQSQAVKVEGEGRMRFFMDKDLSGNRLEKARPVEIAWMDQMLYHGQAGQCIFDRDVHFNSGGEEIVCPRQIRIFFQPKDDTTISASEEQPVPKGSRSFSSMGVDDFSSAKFSSIEADGDAEEGRWVRMQSQRMHPKNDTWVLLRRQIRGRQIIYNDVKGVVKVNGPGDFLAEDYQQPKDRGDDDRRLGSMNEMSGQIDRPSQTLFRWKKDMIFQQASRYVRLRDGVEMIHRSGNKMLLFPGLKTQPFNLSQGRISTLHAGEMDAWFEESTQLAQLDEHGRRKKVSGGDNTELIEGGPDVGKLKLFKAEQDVTMQMADDGSRYGTTTIDGEKILYDDVRKIIEVTGFKEGSPRRTDAQITIEDRSNGMPANTYRAPLLIYDIKNDVIKIDRLQGGGGGAGGN